MGEDAEIRKSARTLGFWTVTVSQPEEAVTRVRDTVPSLIVINLPGRAVEDSLLHDLSREGRPVLVLADPESMPNGDFTKEGVLVVSPPCFARSPE